MVMTEVVSFITVLLVAISIASAISVLYASGLRLWAGGGIGSKGNAHLMHRVCSVLCFVACVAIVLFALWLMIPLFH